MKIYYKPDKKAIENLKPDPTYGIIIGDPLEQAKTIACIYVLQDHSKDRIDEVYLQMYFYLKDIYNVIRRNIREEYYKELKDQENPRISFTHDNWDIDWDFDHTMSWKVKWFTEQAILCPTPDYYEDSERFSHKDDVVSEELEGFVESMEEVCRQEIEKGFEQFKDKAQENEEY